MYQGPKVTVRKSVFIATVADVADEQAARALVKILKQKDRKARHLPFAFRIDGPVVSEGMSDDGEPRSTAGMPLLMLLRAREITGILVVVSRYWGGVKLGPGNLRRAYRDAALAAIENSPMQNNA